MEYSWHSEFFLHFLNSRKYLNFFFSITPPRMQCNSFTLVHHRSIKWMTNFYRNSTRFVCRVSQTVKLVSCRQSPVATIAINVLNPPLSFSLNPEWNKWLLPNGFRQCLIVEQQLFSNCNSWEWMIEKLQTSKSFRN